MLDVVCAELDESLRPYLNADLLKSAIGEHHNPPTDEVFVGQA